MLNIVCAVAVAESFKIAQPQGVQDAQHHVGQRRLVWRLQMHPALQRAVVEDLDEAVRSFHANFGIGPWRAWSLGPHNLRDMVYGGAPAEFAFRHALAWQNEQVQFELVQPLTGPSIFADHLKRHGPGLHHLGTYVADHAAAVRADRQIGVSIRSSAPTSAQITMIRP